MEEIVSDRLPFIFQGAKIAAYRRVSVRANNFAPADDRDAAGDFHKTIQGLSKVLRGLHLLFLHDCIDSPG